jgi:hypothetical protein
MTTDYKMTIILPNNEEEMESILYQVSTILEKSGIDHFVSSIEREEIIND